MYACACVGTVSRAVQPAIHDVTDASALRSWFNPPLATSMSAELYKAQNIVRQFAQVGALYPERSIPAAVLDGAAGFAVLSVVKVSAFDALTAQLLVSSWVGHGQTSLLMLCC